MRWLGLVAFCAVMGVIAVAGLAPRKTPRIKVGRRYGVGPSASLNPLSGDPVLEAWWRERDQLRLAREGL